MAVPLVGRRPAEREIADTSERARAGKRRGSGGRKEGREAGKKQSRAYLRSMRRQ